MNRVFQKIITPQKLDIADCSISVDCVTVFTWNTTLPLLFCLKLLADMPCSVSIISMLSIISNCEIKYTHNYDKRAWYLYGITWCTAEIVIWFQINSPVSNSPIPLNTNTVYRVTSCHLIDRSCLVYELFSSCLWKLHSSFVAEVLTQHRLNLILKPHLQTVHLCLGIASAFRAKKNYLTFFDFVQILT